MHRVARPLVFAVAACFLLGCGQAHHKPTSLNLQALQLEAEQGDPEAQSELAGRYATGEGVSVDFKQALLWGRKAAEQGYYGSQFVLGLMYGYDDSVPRDDLQAYAWFSMLVANGYDTHEAARDEIAARLTPERLAEAQAIASRYFEEYQSKSVKASAGRP